MKKQSSTTKEVLITRKIIAAQLLRDALTGDRAKLQYALALLSDGRLVAGSLLDDVRRLQRRLNAHERNVSKVFGKTLGAPCAQRLFRHQSLQEEIDAMRELASCVLVDADRGLVEEILLALVCTYGDVREMILAAEAADRTSEYPELPQLPEIELSPCPMVARRNAA